MVGVLWCVCSFVSCTVMMSMLCVLIVCSSSVCFLCMPFMFICRMLSLFLFWRVVVVWLFCCGFVGGGGVGVGFGCGLFGVVNGGACRGVGSGGVVMLFVWDGHVHVLLDCLYCCSVVVVQDLCTQCGVE